MNERPRDVRFEEALSVLKKAAPAARQLISQHALQPNSSTFAHIDPGLKAVHSQRVAGARASHERSEAIPGVVLESLLLRAQMRSSESPDTHGWFDSASISCRIVKTGEFDDYCGGVDFVLVFTRDDGTILLALAIDTTLGGKAGQEEKLLPMIQEIRDGKKRPIEYFSDPEANIASGRLADVAMFLGVFDPLHVAELESYRQREGDDALKGHPAQLVMLYEIMNQARVFRTIASEAHGEDSAFAKKYDLVHRMISQILEEKLRRKEPWMQWGADDAARRSLFGHLEQIAGPFEEAPTERPRVIAGATGRLTLVETKPKRKILKQPE